MAAVARPKLKLAGVGAPKLKALGAATAAALLPKAEATSDITILLEKQPTVKLPTAQGQRALTDEEKRDAATGSVAPPAPAPLAPPKLRESMFKAPTKPAKPAATKKVTMSKAAQLVAEAATKRAAQKMDETLAPFSDDLKGYGKQVLQEESENPYAIEGVRPTFPLQTRLGFQKHILEVFDEFNNPPEFNEQLDYDACKKMSATQAEKFEYHSQQKFVREFLRQASPYRGLLIYHGLGVGKTCASIAAAQALFSMNKKRIIVMTPFSLRENFINELSFCGFRHYRLQNYWVKLPISATIKLFAKEVLQLSDDYLKQKDLTNIWVPDFNQPETNYSSLNADDRKQIKEQVRQQIKSRFTFINYNGISATELKKIACGEPDENGYGFFDNATIVIDEVHNMTRLMQGTIDPYLTSIPGLKRKVPLEPITPGRWTPLLCDKPVDPARPYLSNYKRGYLFYRLLATARNSKIIGLSGTPLINFPEELAILMNLLGGYIYTTSLSLTPTSQEAKVTVERVLEGHQFVDFQEVTLAGGNMNVLFSIMPEGMMKQVSTVGTLGARRIPPSETFPTLQELTEEILATLAKEGITPKRAPEFKAEPLLPPNGEEFREHFLTRENRLKNDFVLRKRIQGLVSYYRGNKKELMPQVTVDELVRVPMTPYSQVEYQRVRAAELKATKDKKKGQQDGLAGVGGKMGELWSQIYELSQPAKANSYRMFSRQACNFTFPENVTRPRPRLKQDFKTEVGVEKVLFVDHVSEQRPGEESVEVAEMGGDETAAEREDQELDEGQKDAFLEELQRAPGGAEAAAEVADEDAPVVIAELKAVEGAPVAAVGQGAQGQKTTLTAQQILLQRCKADVQPGEDYAAATRRARNCLQTFAGRKKLSVFGLGKDFRAEIEKGSEPDPECLMKYSPKFVEILKRIATASGSSLVYSQFLEMEGIGIFNTIMKLNGFEPITIQMEDGRLQFTPDTLESLQKGDKVWRYMSFTGGETPDVRAMYLRIFNAKFEAASASASNEDEADSAEGADSAEAKPKGRFYELPPEISKVLTDAGFTGNLRGELCRVFGITSAGAEGLSLRNVRRVHIMEPYWNHVRTDQVKGRAVRICSHMDLEYDEDPTKNERTVEVFTYCTVFSSEAQVRGDTTGARAAGSVFPAIDNTIVMNDSLKPEDAVASGFPIPSGAKQYVLTSDEYLYEISANKKALLEEIQNLMKTSAVDCQLNYYENREDGLGCITMEGTPEQYAFHPLLKTDIQLTSQMFASGALEAHQESASPEEGTLPLAATGDAVEEASASVPVAKPQAPRVKTIQAVTFTDRATNKEYIAIPVQEEGSGIVLSYNIYGRGDTQRQKLLGTMLAEVGTGRPTKKITWVGR